MKAPESESELLEIARVIEGLTFGQLALKTGLNVNPDPLKRKGFVGYAIERLLGADAGAQSLPDFTRIGVELKTIPLHETGMPTESTFIVRIAVKSLLQETWKSSACYRKLKRILWVPIEGDVSIPFLQRRVGRAFLWSPTAADEAILAADWHYLSTLITTGRIAEIDASMGEYLQVRPKAANARALCEATDEEGALISTLPRGFYLRALFTKGLMR